MFPLFNNIKRRIGALYVSIIIMAIIEHKKITTRASFFRSFFLFSFLFYILLVGGDDSLSLSLSLWADRGLKSISLSVVRCFLFSSQLVFLFSPQLKAHGDFLLKSAQAGENGVRQDHSCQEPETWQRAGWLMTCRWCAHVSCTYLHSKDGAYRPQKPRSLLGTGTYLHVNGCQVTK